MIRWSIATNNVYKEAQVCREEGPMLTFLVEWLSLTTCWLVGKLRIPLPNWAIARDSFFGCKHLEEGENTTMREYYGDFHQLWHAKICDPIFQRCDSKFKYTSVMVDLDDAPIEWLPPAYEDYDGEETDANQFSDYAKRVQVAYDEFLKSRDDERLESVWRNDKKHAVLAAIKGEFNA